VQGWIAARQKELEQQKLLAAITGDSPLPGGAAAGRTPSGGHAAGNQQLQGQQREDRQRQRQRQQPPKPKHGDPSSRAASAAAATTPADSDACSAGIDESNAGEDDTLVEGQRVYIQRAVSGEVVAEAIVRSVDPELVFKNANGRCNKASAQAYNAASSSVHPCGSV
jgi:hypothetical protein